jgi:hypothetical protein
VRALPSQSLPLTYSCCRELKPVTVEGSPCTSSAAAASSARPCGSATLLLVDEFVVRGCEMAENGRKTRVRFALPRLNRAPCGLAALGDMSPLHVLQYNAWTTS